MDISHILNDWPYENGQVSARRIVGDDGRQKIQLRLDLGVLQMETHGRPDGKRPHGHDSLLEYHEHQLDLYRRQHGSDDGFGLEEEACEALRAEGTMYYHRYLAEFVLEDFDAVQRDTLRNLRLFDFCATYARDEGDRYALEQYRPYVIMMYTRARARVAMRQNQPRRALSAVREGLGMIKEFYHRYGQDEAYGASSEAAVLRELAKEVKRQIPVSPERKLEKALARAVKEERYEEAAKLRDRLAEMRSHEHAAGTE